MDNTVAKVEPHKILHIVQILYKQRLVQAIFCIVVFPGLFRQRLRYTGQRVTRDTAHQEKCHRRNAEDSDEHIPETL